MVLPTSSLWAATGVLPTSRPRTRGMPKRPLSPPDFRCGDTRRVSLGLPIFDRACRRSCCIKAPRADSDYDDDDDDESLTGEHALVLAPGNAGSGTAPLLAPVSQADVPTVVAHLSQPRYAQTTRPAAAAPPKPWFSLELRAGLALGRANRTRSVEFAMLTRRYPLHHARDSTHDEVAEKLRRMERYEIALQGDDYADKEAQKTNHEALAYARAAASVASITRFKLSELCAGDRQEALQQLKREPYISDFRARQIVDLVRSGTCQALSAFEDNKAPVGSDGRVRLHNEGGRSMSGARSKRELSKVLGISATRAGELWDGIHRDLPRIESVSQLRSLPAEQARALCAPATSSTRRASSDADDAGQPPRHDGSLSRANFSFGLAYHDHLQEPIPAAEAEAMRATVLRLVRQQQGCAGCACACTRPFDGGDGCECAGCDCCWHVEFVGGAPRRGSSGHDVDLLLWHRHKPASWATEPKAAYGVSRPAAQAQAHGPSAAPAERSGSVLGMLLDALEAACRRGEAGLVPRDCGGWQMPRLCHAKRQEVGGVYAHRKPLQAANAESTHGYENLSMDYHDKVFGVWRTAEGRHRRIDLVVCSYPEEIALARLTWIGGRQLNRFMRGYCLSNGLWLSAHALLVKNAGEPLVIRDQQSGQVVTIPAPGEPTPAIVPYKYLRTERHVLYLLGGGTDEFFGLLDARNRNA